MSEKVKNESEPSSTRGLTGGFFQNIRYTVGASLPLKINLGVWVLLGLILGISETDNRLVYSLFVISGWSICICIHEMGHAVFAVWAGVNY